MKQLYEAVTCGVCSDIYQERTKEPLVLPCGHTFCRECLSAIRKNGGLLCPTCRRSHNNLQVERLFVNYALLSLSSVCDFEYETCNEHEDDLRYWCCCCEVPLCSLCLYTGHPQGHKVQLIKACVEEKKLELEIQITLLNDRINDQQEELKIKFMKVVSEVNELCQNSSSLNDTKMNIGHLLSQVKKAKSIEAVMLAETSVKEFQDKMESFESQHKQREDKNNAFGSQEDKMESLVHDKHGKESKNRGTVDDVSQQKTEGASAVQEVIKKNQDAGEVPRAALQCQDGRLLLHCITSPLDTRISLQLPSEVFLELSVGEQRLGRVYIRLWCHLRRAQQFQVLCLGTLGPTYLGVQGARVMNKNSPGEIIIFENMMEVNKPVHARALVSNLEWAGNYSKTVSEGHVLAYESGRTTAGMNPGFCICTTSTRGGAMGTPFAEVVAGLDVVKAAISLDRPIDVKITQCGIVLPDFTL